MKFRDQVVECRKIYQTLNDYYKMKKDVIKLGYDEWKKNSSLVEEIYYTIEYNRIIKQKYNILARIWAKLTWRI